MNGTNSVSIRPWQENDDEEIWAVLQEGSYSLVNATFMVVVQRKEIGVLGSTVTCIGLSFGCSWIWCLCYGLIFISALYILSWISALVYLYGSTLRDIKNIPKSYFTNPDNHFWVAECNGEIAGTIAVIKKTSNLEGSPESDSDRLTPVKEQSKKVALLRRMAVKKKYRGLGVAKKLVLQCLSYCKKQNYDTIFLITTEVHHAARSLYWRLGFKLVGCKPYKYLRGLISVKTYEFEIDL